MDTSYILNELGEDRAHYFDAIAPPIIQTSNFAYRTVDDLRKAFEDEYSGYLYSRGLNPTVDILRKKLAALDGAEDCLVFNSGAAAIFAAVFAQVKSGDHIISVKQPYTWAQHLFDVILPRFGITTTYINGEEIDAYRQALQKNTTVIYLESPNSWTYALQPLREVAQLAKAHHITTIIDNSYCTPIYQRPIEMGIDLCIQTATKYISGHSDTLGGVITGSHEMMARIFKSEFLTVGSGIQPFNAWLLIRGMRTLDIRLQRVSASTERVLSWLDAHPMIDQVIFPFHKKFPQLPLAKEQMSGAGGLFTFTLKDSSLDKITRFCDALRHIYMAVSWGGHESLIIPKCAGIKSEEYDPMNETHQYMRMYVGLEDPDYLIRDIEQALNSIR